MTSFRSFDCAFQYVWKSFSGSFRSFKGEIVWKRAILNCTFLCIVYVMTSQGRLAIRPGLLEAWLVLTSVKYHGNLYILIPLNQRLALTSLWATGPRCTFLYIFCLRITLLLPWKKNVLGQLTQLRPLRGLQGKLTHFTLVHSHETKDKLGQIKIY